MKLTVVAGVVAGVLMYATSAQASPRPPVRIEAALRTASVTYRVSYWTLRRKAWCESRYYAKARNRSSGAAGLFQFLRGTWWSTPYRYLSVYDPYANALAAAWMHRHHRGNEWSCR